ncbi:MAG: hypothetical protein ACOH2D_07915 [Gelidibacter sp.]|uniref:hypothetical protein n=1 Tax=Gelidibacter sp. TaxID=2018083 RepID=UPI003264139C
MSQQINHDNVGGEALVLEAREARLISDTKVKEAELKQLLEISALNKKSFSERMKANRFWLVRGVYYAFYSVWMIVMTIGIAIAWLIAMLFI